jgi:tRNA U34 2-thiouridine synthase MnmA/TrmU
LADAKRVAVQLDIPFKVFDFQKEYKQQVVDYMIAEYEAGRTPNPDIMCNQEIKFDLFLRTALADGADMIATGHYARIGSSHPAPQPSASSPVQATPARQIFRATLEHKKSGAQDVAKQDEAEERIETDSHKNVPRASSSGPPHVVLAKLRATRVLPRRTPLPAGATLEPLGTMDGDGNGALSSEVDSTEGAALLTGLDKNKDQSYFLYRVVSEALSRTLLPIGELTKPEVREQARKLGLATAEKKDSQGICFVGKIGIKDFLQNYVDARPGDIIDKKTGHVLGQHGGAIFYTIGQRHGLHVGGGLPFYVVGKDMDRNEVYITTDLNDENLWRKDLELTQLHWINGVPQKDTVYQVRTRYRAPLINCRIEHLADDSLKLVMHDAERAITAGQSAVLYDGDRVVGGGIVV